MRPLFRNSLASLGIVACFAVHAAPVDFSFTFDNLTGNANGVVTGRILGLQDNASGQQATSVLIDSYGGLGGTLEDADAVQWTVVHRNAFTVANGVLTSWSFLAQDLLSGDSNHFGLSDALSSSSCVASFCLAPFLSLDNGVSTIAAGSLTFTAISDTQEVPEPATLALAGWAAIGLLASRRSPLRPRRGA